MTVISENSFTLSSDIETSSGKDKSYENFPVGSWLLPAALRPHISVFYHFARAIDDIADNPNLSATEKMHRLDGFSAAIRGNGHDQIGYEIGQRMRLSLVETKISPKHCYDLIDAFRQDVIKYRYKNWDQLINYCLRSAAPVGRYLLDLHGGSDHGYGPSDALCNALQVINHLQDCKDDLLSLNRIYLPGNWMAEEGLTANDFMAVESSAALRRVLDRTLDATEILMLEAWRLPSGLNSRRLAMESNAILNIAACLIKKLRHEDPISSQVKLSKQCYIWQCIKGALVVASGIRPRIQPK